MGYLRFMSAFFLIAGFIALSDINIPHIPQNNDMSIELKWIIFSLGVIGGFIINAAEYICRHIDESQKG